MLKYRFRLDISTSDYLRYYRGSAARVIVNAHDGRNVSIPAINLRRFVAHDGIHGRFCMVVDDDQRLVSIERDPPNDHGVRTA